MNVISDGVLDFSENKVAVLCIVALKHANVVGSVDQAVARHFLLKCFTVLPLNALKEVGDVFLVLALHLDVSDFGDDDRVIVGDLRRIKTALQK